MQRYSLSNTEGGAAVWFDGKSRPVPQPEPTWPNRASEHPMLPGVEAPGLTVIQNAGWGSPIVRIQSPYITRTQLDALYSLYRSWTASGRAKVWWHYYYDLQALTTAVLTNPTRHTLWECQWREEGLVATRSPKRLEQYALTMDFLILEITTEEIATPMWSLT